MIRSLLESSVGGQPLLSYLLHHGGPDAGTLNRLLQYFIMYLGRRMNEQKDSRYQSGPALWRPQRHLT